MATACDLPRRTQTTDFGGSVRAGLSAVMAAVNAVRAGALSELLSRPLTVRVAAPESEMEGLLGDAGAAVRLGPRRRARRGGRQGRPSPRSSRISGAPIRSASCRRFPASSPIPTATPRDLDEAIRTLLDSAAPGTGGHREAWRLCTRRARRRRSRQGTRLRCAPAAHHTAGRDHRKRWAVRILSGARCCAGRANAGDWIIVAGYGEGADAVSAARHRCAAAAACAAHRGRSG